MLTEAIAHERIGHLSDFAGKRVERWWVDALFLALDRLIEDRELDGERVSPERYGSLLGRSSFAQIAGARSLEKDLATKHLVALYAACGGRERFSDQHVRERTELTIPDVQWFAANDNRPQGAVHPSNPRFTTRSAEALAGDFTLEDLGFIFVPSSLRRSPDPP